MRLFRATIDAIADLCSGKRAGPAATKWERRLIFCIWIKRKKLLGRPGGFISFPGRGKPIGAGPEALSVYLEFWRPKLGRWYCEVPKIAGMLRRIMIHIRKATDVLAARLLENRNVWCFFCKSIPVRRKRNDKQSERIALPRFVAHKGACMKMRLIA